MKLGRVSMVGALAILAILISPGSLLAQTSASGNFWDPAGKNWPVPGGDWGHTRYSTLTQITPSNVKNLQGAWMTRLNGSGLDPKTTQEGTPIVRDGIMYLPTGNMDIFAVNAKTGAILWEYVSDVDPKYPGRWANRGVDVAEGKVFATQKDGSIIALDQKTGTKIWQTYLNDEDRPRTLISNAPVYFDGMIYSGVSGAGQATRGRFIALDSKTGQIVWKFNTIPGPGDPNFGTWEGDTWMTGGANVWNTATIDPALGMVYFQTGNAFPDYDGAARGGDNQLAAAELAATVAMTRSDYQAARTALQGLAAAVVTSQNGTLTQQQLVQQIQQLEREAALAGNGSDCGVLTNDGEFFQDCSAVGQSPSSGAMGVVSKGSGQSPTAGVGEVAGGHGFATSGVDLDPLGQTPTHVDLPAADVPVDLSLSGAHGNGTPSDQHAPTVAISQSTQQNVQQTGGQQRRSGAEHDNRNPGVSRRRPRH